MRSRESIAATPAAAEPDRGPRCPAPESPLIAGLLLATLPLAPLPLAPLALAPLRAAPLSADTIAADTIAAEPYGRWERDLRRCRLERRGGGDGGRSGAGPASRVLRQGCRGVRVDQQGEGLLSVRFLAGGSAAEGAVASQLSFAGVMESGSRPMRCQQLRCQPDWPIRLRVSAVAVSAVAVSAVAVSPLHDSAVRESRGAPPLRQGQLARGQCQLSARVLRCRARSSDGEEWIAEGRP